VLTESFYWDLNDGTREWSRRFAENHNGNMPTMIQAGVYSSLMHYFKAVEELGNTDSQAVIAKMKEMPTSDPLFGEGEIRADGRKIHDMYLFEVKSPAESEGGVGLLQAGQRRSLLTQAFRPMDEGGCELVQ
jgi:branched-chain amino acid transport system substrate-binding protein